MNFDLIKSVDLAFAQTTKLLFGKEFSPVWEYDKWLLKRIPNFEVCSSVITGKKNSCS